MGAIYLSGNQIAFWLARLVQWTHMENQILIQKTMFGAQVRTEKQLSPFPFSYDSPAFEMIPSSRCSLVPRWCCRNVRLDSRIVLEWIYIGFTGVAICQICNTINNYALVSLKISENLIRFCLSINCSCSFFFLPCIRFLIGNQRMRLLLNQNAADDKI